MNDTIWFCVWLGGAIIIMTWGGLKIRKEFKRKYRAHEHYWRLRDATRKRKVWECGLDGCEAQYTEIL